MVTTGPLLTALYSDDLNVHNDNDTIVIHSNISIIHNSNSSSSNNSSGSSNGSSEFRAGVVSSTELVAATDGYPTASGRTVLLHRIQPEEVIILTIIVIMWMMAVASFLRKWSRIRILQPMEPRYRHSPKNLESVLIVKRAQDSVIYKNYGRKMSVTMVAREKRRLQRLRTLPLLKNLPLLSQVQEVMWIAPSPSLASTATTALTPREEDEGEEGEEEGKEKEGLVSVHAS